MATPTNLPTATPVITDPLGHGYANITALAEAVASRLEREHTIARDGQSQGDHEGLHKSGSAIAFFQESKPAARLDGVAFNATTDKGLIWVKPIMSGANIAYIEIYIYDGADFNKLSTFGTITTDTIAERTAAAGVTVDGVHLVDNSVDQVKTITATESIAIGIKGAEAVFFDSARVKARAFKFGVKPDTPEDGDMWIE